MHSNQRRLKKGQTHRSAVGVGYDDINKVSDGEGKRVVVKDKWEVYVSEVSNELKYSNAEETVFTHTCRQLVVDIDHC